MQHSAKDSVFYDESWTAWSDMKQYGPTSRHQRRLIHSLLAPLEFRSVLDTGCGVGNLLLEISEGYPQVTELAGTDISDGALRACRQRLPDGVFEYLDIQTQALNRQFDLTISVDVLEHVDDDVASLRNIHRMTGKYFLAVTIQGNGLPEWEAREIGHVRNYRRGELQEKMTGVGFTVERVIEWGFPFYSPLYRWYMNLTAAGGTEGEFGAARKLVAQAIYAIFALNSSRRGDVIMVVARV